MSSPVRAVRGTNIWALLIIAVVILGFIVWQQRESDQSGASSSSVSALRASANRPDDAALAASLDRLEQAWSQRDRDRFIRVAGATSAAKSWGSQAYDNLAALGVERIDLEPSSDDTVEAEQAHTRNDGTYDARVDVTWVPGAASGLPARRTDPATVLMRVRADGRLSLESVRATEEPLPLWLAGALDVTNSGASSIVRVDGGTDEPRMQKMLDRAMTDVRRVYGRTKQDAVVVMPSEVGQSADIIGSDPQQMGQIAAITTTLDGSAATNGPVAVVLNPEVFTPLNARAAQIVLTHETTHSVTNAATAVLPLWVAEGYADYVALGRDRLPPTRSASQILSQVRKNGPPKQLPEDADFAASSSVLGATYEGAWMAFRMLGETYGDDAVTAFYREVLRGTSADVAALRNFGVDVDQITQSWRDNLAYWATVPR